MNQLSFGVIGCGALAQSVHLPLLRGMKGVRVTAVCDSNPERLTQAVHCFSYPVHHFSNFRELLASGVTQAILVSTPPDSHAAIAGEVLKSNNHLYLEKPIATDLTEARELVTVSRVQSVVSTIGFNFRFHPLLVDLKHLLETQYLGQPLFARSVFSTIAQSRPHWARTDTIAGVFQELASHEIDLTRFLFGCDIHQVFAQSIIDPSSICLDLHLTNGGVAQVFCSLQSNETAQYEVFGTLCSARVDRYQSWKVRICPLRAEGKAGAILRAVKEISGFPYALRRWRAPANEVSYARILSAFVEKIRTGHGTLPTLEDGLRCLAIEQAAVESLHINRPIEPTLDF
ncbi:MAG: Gfo/Idh/MocA family oxidoreductase [Acidobacteria bacterium]|nr:Gfo/Idh/MocA family oxidoreductase [Acidobacteriota bacterium]